MADPSDGSFNLKHRLVGATVLIVIAVILLPRVLTGTAGESVRPDINQSRVVPDVEPVKYLKKSNSRLETKEALMKTEIEILDEDIPIVVERDPGDIESQDDQGTRTRSDQIIDGLDAKDLSGSESVVTGWVAQVGIFEGSENVSKLINDLRRDGIEAKVETIQFDGRQASRVWLGPFSTRSQATREGYKAMMRTQSKPILKEWP